MRLYFKNGMTAERSSYIGWNTSIIEFWGYLVPEGLYIQENHELMIFLELYRGFANYLGLEDWIHNLIVTIPVPPPVQIIDYNPAPVISIVSKSQKTPSTFSPTQQQPVQQPKATQVVPDLLEFVI